MSRDVAPAVAVRATASLAPPERGDGIAADTSTAGVTGGTRDRIENPYGYYDAAAREFVITRPDTPTPWLNYIGAGGYGGVVSNTGGGFSFDRDPRNRRVTRYRYNGVPEDQPGRYVYIRDQDSGAYWSATWQPVKGPAEGYECRHGSGYTRIRGARGGIESDMLYFVPLAGQDEPCPCELWVLQLRNPGPASRRLRTFSYAEFSFADALSDQTNLDWSQHIVSSRCTSGVITVTTKFNPLTFFFASNEPPSGYTCDREAFVGRLRDLANPLVVETGTPSNAPSARGNSVGSLSHDLELAPGEERTIVFVMGATVRPSEIARTIERFADFGEVERAFEALRADWNAYLGRFTVETPDADTNAMLNFWNPLQCRTALFWSRFVSGYETGLGRGMGTRDSAQDTLGTVHAAPARARQTLTLLWELQFADGHAWHQFYPLTGEGGPGLAAEHPDRPQWFSDDHLWLVISACAYLRETADIGYLQQKATFADRGEATIWEHMRRAVDFTLAHRGPRGLPRAGFADWDDTLHVDHGSGRAESVWTAMQFCRATLEMAEVCDELGHGEDAECYRGLYGEMAAAIEACAWDGDWYARAFDDEGRAVGVAGERHQSINLIPQAWSVIAGLDRTRSERAMRSLDTRLDTRFGIALLSPPYDGFEARIGGTTTYPPGAKENGGIFCHANTWAIVAAAMLGWGDTAYRYYRQFLPLARTDADVYGAEPYVYAQNICGASHPSFGLARNAWLTGTASWTLVAATQWILGIRPTFGGLRIAPVLPAGWPGFRAHREFRGTTYEIEVRRAGAGNAVSLRVDGAAVEGDVVPLPPPGTGSVRVEVTLR